jgi:hypothetical protein
MISSNPIGCERISFDAHQKPNVELIISFISLAASCQPFISPTNATQRHYGERCSIENEQKRQYYPKNTPHYSQA